MANQNNRSPGMTPKAREMAALMAEYERSGETMMEFAERHGMKLSTFSSWRQELRKRLAKPAPKTEFVEIGDANGSRLLELSFANGVKVKVPNGFDAAELERLVRVLGRC